MEDGVNDDLCRIDFVQHLIWEYFNEGTTHSTVDCRIHFGMLLDRLNAFVHTPKEFVSEQSTLLVVPGKRVIGILLGRWS